MSKKPIQKASVRIAITEQIGSALEYLKNTKYPFMKDDELFKMAFSRFYAETVNEYLLESAAYILFQNLREKDPQFGQKYLEKNGLQPKELTMSDLTEMVMAR
jgi:hypothetical protein